MNSCRYQRFSARHTARIQSVFFFASGACRILSLFYEYRHLIHLAHCVVHMQSRPYGRGNLIPREGESRAASRSRTPGKQAPQAASESSPGLIHCACAVEYEVCSHAHSFCTAEVSASGSARETLFSAPPFLSANTVMDCHPLFFLIWCSVPTGVGEVNQTW